MDSFAALSDPTRRSIYEMLASRGELPASDISAQFPVSASAISQHLKILRESGLVLMEKRSQQRIYRINPEALVNMEAWFQRMTQLWEQRFDALDALITVEKNKMVERKDDQDEPK